jgi:ubiquinone/menaquinone biosynthesis C-methylase UbiE
LMRFLESTSSRYDWGIRILTLGRLERVYDRLTAPLRQGQKVLDLGCGTGALTLKAALKGASVKGIDINSQMLDIARQKVKKAGLEESVTFCEKGIAELSSEKSESFTAVTAGLCFSELSDDELSYTLRQAYRVLQEGGLLLVADEVKPGGRLKRLLHMLIKGPVAAVTWMLTQTTTRALRDLPQRIERAGFQIDSVRLSSLESFAEVTARKPDKGETR